MKNILLTKEHDITSFCSTDPNRYVITGVHYHSERKRLEATNGHLLVTVPVIQVDPQDVPQAIGASQAEPETAIIPVAPFRKALANIPKSRIPDLERMKLDANGKVTLTTSDLDATQTVQARPIDGTYPDVERVTPHRDDYKLTIGLNANLLAVIADYAKKHVHEGGKGEQVVRFSFKDELSPVLFEMTTEQSNLKVEGVLMPCRLG